MSSDQQKMPILFVGHGSPMNAIEDNEYTKKWVEIAKEIPRPRAILAISAHWYTHGTRITNALQPEMVYDMYGFPDELYQVKYPAPGLPELAHGVQQLLNREVKIDTSWGCDHGAWSVLCRMYPAADIPVVQLSVDRDADAAAHFRLGQELAALREQGVLIFASGNVVHNLAKINWDMAAGYPWAEEFDGYIKEKIINGQYQDVMEYRKAGEAADLAFFTPEHFYPLLYVLGAAREGDRLSVFNDSCLLGSLSMTCYLFA